MQPIINKDEMFAKLLSFTYFVRQVGKNFMSLMGYAVEEG